MWLFLTVVLCPYSLVTSLMHVCVLQDCLGVPTFVSGPPHCNELCSHIIGWWFSGLSESQQASLWGKGEQRDPVGIYLPLGPTHPQQLLLIHQRVDLIRRETERESEKLMWSGQRGWLRERFSLSVVPKPVWTSLIPARCIKCQAAQSANDNTFS